VKIPLLDLRAQDAAIGTEVRAAIEHVLDTQQFVLGAAVETFEREMAEFCGATEGVGVASGTDALYLTLAALGVGQGTAVITSAYSFISTATSIVRLGARPLFIDIDRETFNLNVDAAAEVTESGQRRRWTERLVGILPVHLFGASAGMERVKRLAEAHELFVVEDAAQAVGAAVSGYPSLRAGAVGDAGCLSFYPTKNLGGLGDGGMVVTSRPEVAQRLRSLRVHGAPEEPYRHEDVGICSRLDALQAVALSVKLRYVDQWNAARRQVAEWYRDGFGSAALVGDSSSPIALPRTDGEAHVFHQYVIRAPGHRDQLRAHLHAQGIATQVYYPIPLPLQPCLRHLGYREGDCPEAERASTETLALPMYPEMRGSAVETIVQAVAEYYRTRR